MDSCYDPLYATVCTRSDGTRYTRIGLQSGITFDSHGRPIGDNVFYPDGSVGYIVRLPCGHCLACRSQQSKVWAQRLLLESQYHDAAYFVTLTYDEKHVPRQVEIDPATGEYKEFLSLRKKDVQLFNKRLRKAYFADRIRFYLAGEYGDQTERPHYHAIYFGLHVDDLEPFGMSETGNQYFISEKLQRVWSVPETDENGNFVFDDSGELLYEPIGFVSVEPANEYTFKYVANYVTKKLGVHFNDYYHKLKIEPPFSLSSRKPGIGYKYLQDHSDEIIESDRIVFGTDFGSYSFRPPRYFYKKLEESGVDLRDSARSRRFAANDADYNISTQTDLLPFDRLAVEEYNHSQKVKQRDL